MANSLLIQEIKRNDDKTLSLTIISNGLQKDFVVNFPAPGSVSLPDELDLMIMSKNFNHQKEFLKTIGDFKSGKKIEFPISFPFAQVPAGV